MKRICLLSMLILVMLGCSPIVRAAVEIELSVGYSPRITAPANPISYNASQSVITLHDEDVDKAPELGLRLGLVWPLYSRNKNTIGVRLNTGHSAFINSASVYASRSFGRFTPSVYVGTTSYMHKSNVGFLYYTGHAAPVLTWGMDLKFQVSPTFNLQASYQHTDRAFVYKHKYTYGLQWVILPSDYSEPVYSIHPINSFYVGGSVNVDVLQYFKKLKSRRSRSTTADIDVDVDVDKKASQVYLEHTFPTNVDKLHADLSSDIYATYQPFIDAVNDILEPYWGDKVSASVVGYIPQTQTMCFRINTSFAFTVNDDQLIYGKIQSEFLNDFIRYVGEMAKQLPSDVPPYIGVIVEFSSYNTLSMIDATYNSKVFIKLDKSTDKGAERITHYMSKIGGL